MSVKSNVKKLIIKNFKGFPTIDQDLIYIEWKKLEREIQAIYASQPLEHSLEELYRLVEKICSFNYWRFLYENVCNLTEDHFKNRLLPFLTKEIDFLGSMNYTWVTLCRQTHLIKNVFLYLDRMYLLGNQRTMSIWNMSMSMFKENVVLSELILPKLVDGLLYLIYQDRNKVSIDRNLLKSLAGMLMTLQIYDLFEIPFFKATKLFYKTEESKLSVEYDVIKYLYHVEKRHLEEKERVINYLNPCSQQILSDFVADQLLNPCLQKFIRSAVHVTLKNNFLNEIVLLYKLLGLLSNGRSELCNAFKDYLKEFGTSIVNKPNNKKDMVQNLIDFKDQIDNIVFKCFEGQEKFVTAVRDSFKVFLNFPQNKSSELLVWYVDSKLRDKDLNEEYLETILNKVMVLFRFVQGKDIFVAFYERHMAKRLLLAKSTSQDSENSMISKLKLECGEGFTSKLEGMFKDVAVSQVFNGAFRQYLNSNMNNEISNNCNIDMFVNVLTRSYWPNYPTYEINLPTRMVLYQNIFIKFYMCNHKGRKLQWQSNLGYCIMKAKFLSGKKELQLSLFQAIVLLLFNNRTEHTFKDISEQSKLEQGELKRTLQSLSCGKTAILLKTPKENKINYDDIFIVNNDFTNKLFRVKINQIQMKETIEERTATEKSVLQDRQFQIDAAIVRIMKQEKTLSHTLLMTNLFDILDIPVKPSDIKKRIEQLIERDYLERDKDNSTIYKYVA